MRSCVILMAVAFFVPTIRGDEPAKANSLTAKEIVGGWILLFDGETTFGWTIDGESQVKNGVLILGGKKETVATLTLPAGELYWEYGWRDDMKVTMTVEPPKDVKHWSSGLGFSGAGYTGKETWNAAIVTLEQTKDGSVGVETNVDSTKPSAVPAPGITAQIKVQAPFFPAVGTLKVAAGNHLTLRNVKFKPSGLQPLFNGKDLSGWKQFTANARQAKSKFSVTTEGWLNVADGPGDLQTEKQFDDFLLQVDCISNGINLNSGIFFRAIPGEYQQGYEAQIHNGFAGEDRTKPLDYGTGAIYRRQPARKVVPNDQEWFTMTVMAQDNRLRTWVNGYPVADFTDTRAAADNGRNGSKTGAGAISIQGHDKTTNLSFRNIRIVELPRK